MIIRVEPLEIEAAAPRLSTCATRAPHLRAACLLPSGHGRYHETRVRVRLLDGGVMSYRYSWLDRKERAAHVHPGGGPSER